VRGIGREAYSKVIAPRLCCSAVGAVSLAVLVTACGGASTPPLPHTDALVRPADIAKAGRGSAGAAALQLWRSVQLGDAVSAASFYHERVLKKIGFARVSGTLAQQRSHLEVLRPTVVSVNQTPVGAEVIVKGKNVVGGTRQNPVEVFSFVLRRSAGGWRVAYDTLLGDSLPSYVQAQVQQQLAPGSRTPLPRAQLAGQRVGDEYRSLFSGVTQQRLNKRQKKGSG
jgi:hypothetical protein